MLALGTAFAVLLGVIVLRAHFLRLPAVGASLVALLTLMPRHAEAECAEEQAEVETCPPMMPMLGTRNPVAEVQAFGMSGSLTRSRFSDESTMDGAVLVSGSHFSYDTRKVFSGRSYGFGFIGGGSAGFEGGFGGELGFGLRVPFAETHGPVARVALEGFLMGNDTFYASALELPKGELGYQLLDRVLLIEVAATAGPVLTGQFEVNGLPRRDFAGHFAAGAHLAAGFRNAHLDLAVNRLDSGDSRVAAFDELTGSLCGLPSIFAICADARYFADGAFEPDADVRVAYLGFHVGLVTSSAPKRAQKRRGNTLER
jgi:hypothetical protein